jgi:arylsulfatase A-like enzyme
MPIPHPYGIYSRERKDYAMRGSSYIDNLALADRYLDHTYELLERSGAWDSATVVVMGDHSWRAHLQRNGTAQSTAEDEAASHGGEFDDRPAYIVKLPQQTRGFRIETSFPALRTRELLRKMMSGEVRSPKDLAVFAR